MVLSVKMVGSVFCLLTCDLSSTSVQVKHVHKCFTLHYIFPGGFSYDAMSKRTGCDGVKVRHTYRLGGFNEDLAASKLELILVHVDRLQEMKDALFLISSPRWPRLFGEDGVPEDQFSRNTTFTWRGDGGMLIIIWRTFQSCTNVDVVIL